MVRRWCRVLLWTLVRAPLFLLLGSMGSFGRSRQIDPGKVAIYIRWSTDDQTSGTTLDVQRDACLDQARAWQFGAIPADRIFIDDGYSGGDLNRPAITKLRELVKRGQVHCVIVYKIDRLSRNIVDATHLVLREWEGVCDLRCVMDPVDTTTDVGKMFFGILANFADYERQVIRSRMATGRTRRAAEGRNPGVRLPYGYTQGPTTGEIVQNEAQAAVVRRIFESYAAGRGCIAIASELNREGLTGFSGREWSQSTIQKMLVNQAYIGRMIYGRSTRNRKRDTLGGPVRLKLDEPLVVREDVFPALVSPDLFDRCQRVKENRSAVMKKASGRALSSENLLTGLLRCRCGHRMRAWKPSPNHGGKRPAYVCEGRITKGRTFCDATRIYQDALDAAVMNEVKRLTQPDFQAAFLAQRAETAAAIVSDLEAQVAGVEARVKTLESEEQKTYRDYRAGMISAGTLEHLKAEIASEKQQAIAGLAHLRERLTAARDDDRELASVENTLALIADWDRWDKPKRKQLLRNLIMDLVAYRAVGSQEVEFSIRFRALTPTTPTIPLQPPAP